MQRRKGIRNIRIYRGYSNLFTKNNRRGVREIWDFCGKLQYWEELKENNKRRTKKSHNILTLNLEILTYYGKLQQIANLRLYYGKKKVRFLFKVH